MSGGVGVGVGAGADAVAAARAPALAGTEDHPQARIVLSTVQKARGRLDTGPACTARRPPGASARLTRP